MTEMYMPGRPRLMDFRSVRRLAAALLFLAAAWPAFAAAPIAIQIDRAKLIKLPARAATVVIGNPLIADVSIEPNGLAVVTGKGYGATNFIVLDKEGAVLTEQTFEVNAPVDGTVVVYRGVDRETYSCTPECSRRITLGDDPDYFNKTLSETTTRNTQAIAAGAAQQPH
jgi:Pilus formation protein N terminal region